MYKKIESNAIDQELKDVWGEPVLVMADEYGGQVAVVVDDHCYLAKIKMEDKWVSTPYLFRELFEEMKNLPLPQ